QRRWEDPSGGARAQTVRPLGGLRIGSFGLTMVDAARSSRPGPDIAFNPPIAAGKEAVGRLQAEGAQVVVGVTHQEIADDRALAAAVDLDLILGGHQHDPMVAAERKNLIPQG